MKLLAVSIAGLLLAACGAKQVGTNNARSNPKDSTHQGSGCPATPPPTTEQLTLTYGHAAAAKVAMKFQGETTYHYSECANIPQTGMQVSVSRPIVSALVVNIDLNRAYTDAGGVTTLPGTQQLEIDDLHNCDSSAPTPVFSGAAPVSLAWKVVPSANGCAPQIQGTYSAAVSVDGTPERAEEALVESQIQN